MRRSRLKSSALAIAAALERASRQRAELVVAEPAVSVGDGEYAEQPRAKLDQGVHPESHPGRASGSGPRRRAAPAPERYPPDHGAQHPAASRPW